jgi:hypothetical protein
MNISTVFSAVLRRWYVALVVVALSGFYAQQVWQKATPQYTASMTMTVLPSKSLTAVRAASGAGESSLGNPFGVNAVSTLSALLQDSISNEQVVFTPEAAGAQVAIEASQDATSYFTVVAVGDTPAAPNEALDDVAEQAPAILGAIQTGAGSPGDQLYTSYRTYGAQDPSVAYPDRQRAALGVLLAGLLAAALISVLVDSLFQAFRGRRRRTTKLPETPISPEEPSERRSSERRSLDPQRAQTRSGGGVSSPGLSSPRGPSRHR